MVLESRHQCGERREVGLGQRDQADHHGQQDAVPDYGLEDVGFPAELMQKFEREIGRGTLGNKTASGTEIIEELGAEHMKTGKPMLVMVSTEWCPACQVMKRRILPQIRERGLLRRVAFASVNPDNDRELSHQLIGIGPIPAVRKLLERSGIALDDVDLVELNEAFASQSLAVIRELGLDREKVNVNGGAIALGHPLGMSGARLVVSLLHELRRRGGRYGLATLCVGVGQGQAALFER